MLASFTPYISTLEKLIKMYSRILVSGHLLKCQILQAKLNAFKCAHLEKRIFDLELYS